MFSAPSSRRVKSVQTGFQIIHVLQNHDGASLNQLAEKLGLAKSTVHNYLSTLESMGYVVNHGGTYRLGLRFLTHGRAAKAGLESGDVVERALEEIAREISQAAWWVVEEFGRGIFVEKAVPEDDQQIYGRIGKRSYLHTHGPGKAILAELSEEYVREIIDYHGLPVYTTQTIVDADDLLAELDRVREQGYAFSDGEAALGVQSVGVAFEDGAGRSHAIGVFGHSHDFGGERLDEEIPSLLRATVDDVVATLEAGDSDR